VKVPRKGNPHIHVHLDPVVKRFLHGYAISHDTTTAKLGRRVLAEWVHERVGSTPEGRVGSTLHAPKTLYASAERWMCKKAAGGSTGGRSAS
jgi:hypothetical protein